MRVTQNMLTQQLLYNVSNINERIQTDQEQLSTGKTLNRASDSPLAVSQDMAVSSALAQTTAYQNTITSGLSWMQNTEAATQSMISSLQNVQQNVLEALNTSTANPSELRALVETAQQNIAQIYSGLDTKQGNDYAFGGALVDTPPSGYAQGSSFAYGSSGTVYNSVGAGTSPNSVQQTTPLTSIASSMTGTISLSTATPYELSIQVNSISVPTGSLQPTFSGTIELIDPSNPGTPLATATMSGVGFGSTVTLTGTGGSLSITLGDMFESGNLSSGTQQYSQSDTFEMEQSGTSDPRLANLSYQVGAGIDIPVNLTAAKLFHSVGPGASKDLQSTLSSIINDLSTASNALNQVQVSSASGSSSSGTSAYQQDYEDSMTQLRQDLADLQANSNQVVNANSDLGTRIQRMTAMQNQVSQYVQTLSDQKTSLEDANMAQVITQFSTDQNVYQAALQMGAKVIMPSLINFL